MREIQFPRNFIYGAAAAALQIEGAWNLDGKGPSIWDDFSARNGKTRNGDRPCVACDHYHRYREDVGIMKSLKLDAYRLSVSWPRVMPSGKGPVNRPGLDFYNRLVDELCGAGITPFVTLFHWDLPLALQKEYGGFADRRIIDDFTRYTEVAVKALGDRVKHWITINEPWEYAAFGHFLGYHAPGKKSLWKFFRVMHNVLLAHSSSMNVIKGLYPDSQAGITISMTPVHPSTNSEKDIWSAMIGNQFMNHITLSPLLKGVYPEPLWKRMRLFTPKIQEGDMERISGEMDFLGLNVYSREFAMHKWHIPFLNTWVTGGKVPDAEYEKDGRSYSSMGWEIYPDSIYESLKIVQDTYGNPPVYITENGAPFTDVMTGGRIIDPKRIDYLRRYLGKVYDAYSEGADIRGYFAWSLLDNFEWAEGFQKRFGIVHVDYETLKRTVKDSGYWYRDFITVQKGIEK